MSLLEGKRVALVHEWLVGWGGSESVLQSLANLLPEAPIYAAIWDPDERIRGVFEDRDIRVTRLQYLPSVGKIYRWLLPLMPGAFRALDLSEFDVVVSSSHAFSKAVRVKPGTTHVCYCHTPPRYLWDLHGDYLPAAARWFGSPLLFWLRRQDLVAANRVDHFIANSRFVAERIRRIYGRKSSVIYPPVDLEPVRCASGGSGSYYLAGGRMVRYKSLDVAILAANKAGFELVVFGKGPDKKRLEGMAGPTVRFEGSVSPERLAELISGCRAYLFPGVEDFGILPVEVQAGGRPVVALGRGGAKETVIHEQTGILYEDPSVDGLLEAIALAESREWSEEALKHHADRFCRHVFEESIAEELEQIATSEGG